MKHDWQHVGGLTYQCKKCGTHDDIGCDWVDSVGIPKEMKRIAGRNDCPGKPRKVKPSRKPKAVFKRHELLHVTDNHGGYLSGCCTLCGASGWLDQIKHDKKCLLANPAVLAVKLVPLRKVRKR